MTTIWLLVAFTSHHWGAFISVVDRFLSLTECQRMQKVLEETDKRIRLKCIERKE